MEALASPLFSNSYCKQATIMRNSIRKGDIFINEQFAMRYKILDYERGGKIYCEYTRNGVTITHAFAAKDLLPSLMDKTLFTKAIQ